MGRKLIVIAEDEPAYAKILKQALEKDKYRVIVAVNGEELLKIIRGEKPVLVILDLIMPVKNGFDVLVEMKKDKQLKHIRVIALSNIGQAEDIEKAKELGVDEYIIKSDETFYSVMDKIRQQLKVLGGEYMKKILVIEDERPYMKLLNDQLTANGYNVIQAKDGKRGLSIAKKEQPDLILLDIKMPVMDGITMLKKLRKDIYGKYVKVIILTNFQPNDNMIKRVLEDQPGYYLVKNDISLTDLLEKIAELLS